MARTRGCGPLKMLRTWIGKSSRLYIFGLVIQDHIESIGKPILLKGDEVLLNGLFAQVLSDSTPKPSTTFSIPNMSKTYIPTRPHRNFHIRSHRVHLDLATAKTLTNRIHRYGSRSHRDGLANSL